MGKGNEERRGSEVNGENSEEEGEEREGRKVMGAEKEGDREIRK